MKRRTFVQAVGALLAGLGISLRPSMAFAQAGDPRVEIVSGWTGVMDFRLKADGAALVLTGMTVALILIKSDGTLIDTAGDTSVLDAADGKVRYSPDVGVLVTAASPIRMRWKVTDSSGRVVYHPSGRPAWILIRDV